MRKLIYAIVSILSLVLINSCGLTDNRESKVHDYLQQRVTSESQAALRLDNFKKINGYDQNIAGMKRYIIEWQADISTQQEIWKSGNFLAGYWSDFGVMHKQPGSMDELMMASSSKHFNAGTKIRLTGDCYLQKTEQGWRVEDLDIKTSQTLNEGSATNSSNNVDGKDAISLIKAKLRILETQYQKRTDLYTSVIKTSEASANFEK